jgi:hypothetical protein
VGEVSALRLLVGMALVVASDIGRGLRNGGYRVVNCFVLFVMIIF